MEYEYFRYRDSLSGQMNKCLALRIYEMLKNTAGYGCILIKLCSCGDEPFYIAEKRIEIAASLDSENFPGEIFRIEEGNFMIFAENYEKWYNMPKRF